jgi:hypothetical protein
LVIGFATVAMAGCSHNTQRGVATRPAEPVYTQPSSDEQRRAEERREERRAEDRRAEERAEEKRAEDRRAEERREEEKLRDRDHDKDARRSVGGGPVRAINPSNALDRLVAARCDREVRCNNVGPKEKFASRAECVAKYRDDRRDEINADKCPGGVDENELEECVHAIRSESCGNPFGHSDCRTGNLCLK